jgi:hypothetical protein
MRRLSVGFSFFAASATAQETVVSTPTRLRDLKGMGMSSMGMSSMGMSSMGMSSMGMSSMGMNMSPGKTLTPTPTPTPTPNDDAITGTAQADTTSYQVGANGSCQNTNTITAADLSGPNPPAACATCTCGACYEITLTGGDGIARTQKVKVVDLTGTKERTSEAADERSSAQAKQRASEAARKRSSAQAKQHASEAVCELKRGACCAAVIMLALLTASLVARSLVRRGNV